MTSSMAAYAHEAAREERLEQASARLHVPVLELGRSVEGRALRAVRVPALAESAPTVLVHAAIHGVEWIAVSVALELLHRLITNDVRVIELRKRAHVVIVPCVNVDAFARTEVQHGRGTLQELRCNAHGVDLNRNFPLPDGERVSRLPTAGSNDPTRATYRGPHALSEPEARALDALSLQHPLHAAVSLHSFMGSLIPPCVRDVGDARNYAELCTAVRNAQSHGKYLRLQSRRFDVFTGELDDHLHHARRCWSFTLESFPVWSSVRQHVRAPSLFARFNPRDPTPWVDSDVNGVVAGLLHALALPRPGARALPSSS